MEGIEAISITRGEKKRYVDAGMNHFLEEITDSYFDIMNRRIGELSFDMLIQTEEDPDLSRHSENSLCELVADAFREIGQADIGMINAGSIRNNLLSGEITFNTVLNILPYSNDIQIAEMNGKTLMDVLEFGCRSLPEINSGFIYRCPAWNTRLI